MLDGNTCRRLPIGANDEPGNDHPFEEVMGVYLGFLNHSRFWLDQLACRSRHARSFRSGARS